MKHSKKQLLKLLKEAYAVCHPCGVEYGICSSGSSTMWNGNCDVCGKQTTITEARDYGYLLRGIRSLTKATKP